MFRWFESIGTNLRHTIFWRDRLNFILLALLLIASANGCSSNSNIANAENEAIETSSDSRLATIKERGELICGIGGEIPGFSFVDAEGRYAGIDVDFCRAVASALFDDPNRVKFRSLNAKERFEVLKSGEIDLLSRNTTQTLSRDSDENLEFTPPIFYDRQGIMVNRNSGIESIADLQDKAICVAENTTSYDNLLDYMSQQNITYTPMASSKRDSLYDSYEKNVCQAITGDISHLVVSRTLLANPKEHQILPLTISQEPLAPVVLQEDSQWFDVVKWVTYTLVQAEELGIDSENLNSFKSTQDSEIKRFLGVNSDLGSQMGLSDDFTARIIKHVGNYGEIYDRNIGQPFNLERGQNALWTDGGLMYSPPFN